MGYTHYWEPRRTIGSAKWVDIKRDAQALINAFNSPEPSVQFDYDDTRPPLCDDDQIWFNGIGDEGHETFVLARTNTGFVFCKTARKSYDTLVCAILAVAQERAPHLGVSSDGLPHEWKKPLEWASQVLNREVPCPPMVIKEAD